MNGRKGETAARQVQVELAGREYLIHIGRGILAEAGRIAASLAPGAKACVITDENVAALHLPRLEAALSAAGVKHTALALPPGEATKSFAALERVTGALLSARLGRDDLVIAFGGGVIGDLAGFAAAITRRGLRYIQVPTTLLAQVDSSVGGKTAVNTRHGKNLIGAFHQPAAVIGDTALLDTLPAREFRAGYAETVKYGLLGDLAFFEWLEAGAWRGIFEGGPEREIAVEKACLAKAAIVARDETETGERALLNLGHTFGHALEAVTGYDGARLVHGESVAIGMAQAFRFSAAQGLCERQEAVRAVRHLEAAGLPVRLGDVPGGAGTAAALIEAIKQDKKVKAGKLTFILVKRIGESFIAPGVEESAVAEFLEGELSSR